MARANIIPEFCKEREEAIESMIQIRKDKWSPIAEERQKLRNEIGRAMAEHDFIEVKGYIDEDAELNPILEKINQLIAKYNDHVESYKLLANQLDKEMALLESIKHTYKS